MLEYEQICKSLKTGDLLFFSGKSAFSNLIKLATHSEWSHIGIIIGTFAEGLFCWEANKIEKDMINIIKCGVEVFPLKERILNYKGDIAVRTLQGLDLEYAKNTVLINELIKELSCFPYEKNTLELIKSVYDGSFGLNMDDLSSVFCSELVAAAYQRLGLLAPYPYGLPANEYTPADFTRNTLTLLRGSLSQLTVIVTHAPEVVISGDGLMHNTVVA